MFLALAVWGLVSDQNKARRYAGGAAFLAFWLAFGWYAPIALSDRFLHPLFPLASFYAAGATLLIWERASRRLRLLGAAAVACVLAVSGVAAAMRRNPGPGWGLRHPDFRESIQWMDSRFDDTTKVVMNADDFFLWLLRASPRKACLRLPHDRIWRFSEAGAADYVVLFGGESRHGPKSFRKEFSNKVVAIYARTRALDAEDRGPGLIPERGRARSVD